MLRLLYILASKSWTFYSKKYSCDYCYDKKIDLIIVYNY